MSTHINFHKVIAIASRHIDVGDLSEVIPLIDEVLYHAKNKYPDYHIDRFEEYLIEFLSQ